MSREIDSMFEESWDSPFTILIRETEAPELYFDLRGHRLHWGWFGFANKGNHIDPQKFQIFFGLADGADDLVSSSAVPITFN